MYKGSVNGVIKSDSRQTLKGVTEKEKTALYYLAQL